MDVQSYAALSALAAKLRINAGNGNVVNGSTPGFAVRAAGAVGRSARAAYSARSATPAQGRAMPAGFAKLKLDLPELIEHLSNAKELYTAYSVVSKTANQMYGTMLDILDEGGVDDGEDIAEEDSGMIAEADMESKLESLENEGNTESAGDEIGEAAGAGLDASA